MLKQEHQSIGMKYEEMVSFDLRHYDKDHRDITRTLLTIDKIDKRKYKVPSLYRGLQKRASYILFDFFS
jgi:hypothetical protein